jgi:hypothetical protein
MASILHFPRTFFAESPQAPLRTSPSAEEAALNRPRPQPHLVIPRARPASVLTFEHERCTTVARIDLTIARRSNQSRLRRLFSPSDYTDNWPLGAA